MNLKPELGKHGYVLPFTSRSVRRKEGVAEFCVCTFFLACRTLSSSLVLRFLKNLMDRLRVKAPREPQCTDGEGPAGPRPQEQTTGLLETRSCVCSSLTQGDDGVRSDHRGHDDTLDLGEGLGGRGHTAAWGCPGPCRREGRWAYCTAQGEASPGEGREWGAYCTAQGEASPGQRAWGASRALRGSLLGDAARIDRIRRVVLWSTLAGQSWATSPKVKTYFTCKENWFCSKSMAEENEL